MEQYLEINTKMSKKKIEPVYRKCKCGRRIIHHHIECDHCHKKRELAKKLKGI